MSSYIHLGIVMFASIPSIFTALFIGAWTDTVGRRPALALPAIGSTLEALVVILTMYFEWPIYVLFVGSAISGMCGFFTTMVLAVMSYIADTTDESDRSFRLGKCLKRPWNYLFCLGSHLGEGILGKFLLSICHRPLIFPFP